MLRIFVSVLWGIIVCGLALLALSLIVNFNGLKPQIEVQMTALLQQKVVVNGDINPGMLGGQPALVMHKVDIGLRAKADTVALTVQSLHSSHDFFVHADGLRFDNYLLGDYDIPVTVQPAGFDIPSLKGELEGAKLTGEIKYTNNKLHIDVVLKNLPLGKIAEGAEGKIDGKMQVDGKGADSAQLIHTLNGHFMLTGGAGTLSNKSLNFWSRDVLINLLPGQKETTTLNCTIVDFTIENGVAQSRAIVVDTDENTIFAKGSVDLEKRQVNMLLQPNPKDISLVNLATPVQVTGPIGDTVVTVEPGGMVKKLGGMLLGVVNPTLMLIPLLEKGFGNYNGSCVDILKQNHPRPL